MSFDKLDAQLLRATKYLRQGAVLKVSECIMADKRVDVFKGTLAVKALLAPPYAKVAGAPRVATEADAVALLQRLMDAGVFLRARSPNNTKFLQPDMSRTWSDDAIYAWIYEGSQTATIVGSIALLSAVLGVILFPLWPASMRSGTSYLMHILMYLCLGFIAFLVVISILRGIFYALTAALLKPGIWIFPNLWADCGFFESFVPLWEWEKPAAPPGATAPAGEEKKTN